MAKNVYLGVSGLKGLSNIIDSQDAHWSSPLISWWGRRRGGGQDLTWVRWDLDAVFPPLQGMMIGRHGICIWQIIESGHRKYYAGEIGTKFAQLFHAFPLFSYLNVKNINLKIGKHCSFKYCSRLIAGILMYRSVLAIESLFWVSQAL